MVWSPLAGSLLRGRRQRGRRGPEGSRRTRSSFHVVDAHESIAYLAHVRRLEQIAETRRWLAETLGLLRPGALPHLRKSGSADGEQHYTPVTRALVAEIFRRDFELVGYRITR